MRYRISTFTLLLSCFLSSCLSGKMEFAKDSPAKLLTSVAPPQPGFLMQGSNGNILYFTASPDRKPIVGELTDSLTLTNARPFAAEVVQGQMGYKVWNLGDDKIFSVRTTYEDDYNRFEGVTHDAKTGLELGRARLNEVPLTENIYASVGMSPDKKHIAFITWDHSTTNRTTVQIVFFDQRMQKTGSFSETYLGGGEYSQVLGCVVSDRGEPIVIRSVWKDDAPSLLVEYGSEPRVAASIPLPKEMANEKVHAEAIACSVLNDRELFIAVGMNDDENMKGLLTYKINVVEGTVLHEESIALTSEKAKEISGGRNLNFFTPHTILQKEDGTLYVVTEGMKVSKTTETSEKSSHKREYYQVFSGDVVVFAFDSSGKSLWSRKVIGKTNQEYWNYVFVWEKTPDRFWHRSFWQYTCAPYLRGEIATIFFTEKYTLKAVDIDLSTGNVLRNYPLISLGSLSAVSYRDVVWQNNSTIVLSGMTGMEANSHLMRIALPE